MSENCTRYMRACMHACVRVCDEKLCHVAMREGVVCVIDVYQVHVKQDCAMLQGERVLFVVEEEDLVDEDFLIYLTEFIVSGFITPLFSYEEQTTIINSIRTEVTQAGLTYTRQVAWQFFLRSASVIF